MTIKDFSKLVDCNPQTLRYYDQVNLLKPVKVDPWSGYRYYEEEQALVYVKIKNLQKAGFTIDEIKELLDQDDSVIYEAFGRKIAEQEKRLQEIKDIQQSYQNEMTMMAKKLESIREKIVTAMMEFDPMEEFGMDPDTYGEIVRNIDRMFEDGISQAKPLSKVIPVEEDTPTDPELRELLNVPDYRTVYEKHNWSHVKDFLEDFSDLEDGGSYRMIYGLDREKYEGIPRMAFPNITLSMLLLKNEGKHLHLECQVAASEDDRNHFWLLQK